MVFRILLALALIWMYLIGTIGGKSSKGPQSKQGPYLIAGPQPFQPSFYPWQPAPADYYYPPDDYYYPPEAPPASPRSSSIDIAWIFMLIYGLRSLRPTAEAAPTAAPTEPTTAEATTDAVTQCPWGDWGACSAACKGTRTRSRTCSSESQTESCNTQTGFEIANGWYRASNCYDYTVGLDEVSYDDADASCQAVNARLASSGIRDTKVRTEVMAGLFNSNLDTVFAFVGARRASGTDPYVWTDSFTGDANLWDMGEPGTAFDCLVLVIGNAQSGHDADCSPGSGHNYICERKSS